MACSRLACSVLLLTACARPPAPTAPSPADEATAPEPERTPATGSVAHLSPDHGTLIVLNKGDATASLIDLGSREIVATVATGQGPHEVAVSPAGNVAVVTNYGTKDAPGNTLTVIDVAPGRVMDTVTLSDFHRPHGIEFIDDETVLVTVEEEKTVLCVDYHAHSITCTMVTDQDVSHMVSVTPDRTRAFVANIGSGTVTGLDLQQRIVIGSVPTGAGAEGIDVTPDGKQLWVTNRDADTVTVLDPQSMKVLGTLTSSSFPIRAVATPSGEHVLVTNARSGVVNVFSTETLQPVVTIPLRLEAEQVGDRLFGDRFGDSSVPIGILVHPEGHEAYVAHAHADVITVLDLDNFEAIGTLPAGKEPDGLGYSDESVQPAAESP